MSLEQSFEKALQKDVKMKKGTVQGFIFMAILL